MGCGDKSDDGSGRADLHDTEDDSGGHGSQPGTLPDLRGEAEDPGGCEEVLGAAAAGAASMFFGEYEESDGAWVGEERWLLFANQTWRDLGGTDCVVVWSAEATQTDAPACTGCDLGLQTTLTLDEGATTCDPAIVGGSDGTEAYGIARASGGDATWYLATTQERFGDGHHIDGALNFLTDPSCRWW